MLTSHSLNVLVECGLVLKGIVHVSHRRGIPVADVPVGCGGIGLVREPWVYRRLKIRIIKRGAPDIARPIGCPTWVILKRVMNRRFVCALDTAGADLKMLSPYQKLQ